MEIVKIPVGSIPNSVKELSIDVNLGANENQVFESVLEVGSIPDSVEVLKINHKIIKHNPLKLVPPSVKRLKLFTFDSGEGDLNLFPPTIQKLKIKSFEDWSRNPYVFAPGCFPPSITELDIHTNIKVEPNLFPCQLKRLKFVTKQKLTKGILPDSLEHVEFYTGFTQDITQGDIVPDSVKSLQLPSTFKTPFKNTLPSVKSMIFGIHSGHNYGKVAPGLTYLEVREGVNRYNNVTLPTSLTVLDCRMLSTILKGTLPPTLEILILYKVTTIEAGSIPQSVTKITFNEQIVISLEKGTLPSSLKKLSIKAGVSSETTFPVIPENVKSLVLGCSDTNQIYLEDGIPINSLPESIERLSFIRNTKPIYLPNGTLPPKLKVLEFKCFSQIPFYLEDFVIPISVEIFRLPICSNIHTLEYYYDLIFDLLSNTETRMEIDFGSTKLLAIGRNDPYIYFHSTENGSIDGFILKSNLKSFLLRKQ
eukprot:gene8078-9938_t